MTTLTRVCRTSSSPVIPLISLAGLDSPEKKEFGVLDGSKMRNAKEKIVRGFIIPEVQVTPATPGV